MISSSEPPTMRASSDMDGARLLISRWPRFWLLCIRQSMLIHNPFAPKEQALNASSLSQSLV